ncbi:MAG: DUF4097 domain-containing protein [Promicromonosporaceae bacterium]|nr:DUF4097 domain-containing protein [Promicromonosporaceae bacterium]
MPFNTAAFETEPWSRRKKIGWTITAILTFTVLSVGGVLLFDLTRWETVTATETAAAAPNVHIVADGRVFVRATPRQDIEIIATGEGGLIRPTFTTQALSSDTLRIENSCANWTQGFLDCSGSLEVLVPLHTNVVIETENDLARAFDVAGTVEITTNRGQVDVSRISGDLTVDTQVGAVRVWYGRGDVDVRTLDGGVRIYQGRNVTVHTRTGPIEINYPSGDIAATSSSGIIAVWVDAPAALTVEADHARRQIEGPADPAATRRVDITTDGSFVAFLDEAGRTIGGLCPVCQR